MKNGIFITFEGTEGCGKSTQAKKAELYLISRGFDVLLTREPGGTGLGERIRDILLGGTQNMHPLSELLLYQASRAEHMQRIVMPALKKNKIVLCDRFVDSTTAYQSYGRGVEYGLVQKLNSYASFGIMPDLTILIDAPLLKGLKAARRISDAENGDRLEREGPAFHRRVKKGFGEIARKNTRRIKIIKQRKNIDDTFREVSIEIERVINK